MQTNPVIAAAGKTPDIANSLVNGTTTWKPTAQRPVIVVVAVVVVEEVVVEEVVEVVVVVVVVVVGEVVESAVVSKRKSFYSQVIFNPTKPYEPGWLKVL